MAKILNFKGNLYFFGGLKTWVIWYVSERQMQGRKAVLAAVCEQEDIADMGFTLDAMRLPLEALGYEIIGELPVLAIFDRAKVKEKKEILFKASKQGSDLAKALS